MTEDPRRSLPSVDTLVHALAERPERRELVTDTARTVLQRLRSTPDGAGLSVDAIVAEVVSALEALAHPSLARVINASGVILQTNLGRAPLSEPALRAMSEVAAASNLEFDLEDGSRGSRHEHVRALVARTTNAEDGIAVNNNAAALFFVLQAFAQGREVIVSRGQAVEIGGGFRIPDVLRQSGARLVEVGTTNRTYARDHEEAITPDTAAILRVHTSNFEIVGFTTQPTAAALADVAHRHGILLIDDLGSGCLVNTEEYGLAHEPTVQESIGAGVDLALFSGDKLLGGPQAGIVAGRSALVAELRRHPLARALRLDKTTIAALNSTLLAYLMGRHESEIPIWRMLRLEPETVRRRARAWARAAGEAGIVVPERTMVGGGSLPGQGVPTWCAAIRTPNGAESLARALRLGKPAVVPRIKDDTVLLDPRTVDPTDDIRVQQAITTALTAVPK